MTGRIFAIGDIHGCAGELEALLRGLDLARGDVVVCIGDYLDRGPDSRGVIEQILALRAGGPAAVVCLKGNHEDMCLGWLGLGGRYGEAWMDNGGRAALQSYGAEPGWRVDDVRAVLPPAHVGFLTGLAASHVAGEWLFVHAGVRPGVALEHQDEEDLLWIRGEFLRHDHGLPWTVVFGHSRVREVRREASRRIGIDTGCVYGGLLTALEIPTGLVHQVVRGERRVRRHRLLDA